MYSAILVILSATSSTPLDAVAALPLQMTLRRPGHSHVMCTVQSRLYFISLVYRGIQLLGLDLLSIWIAGGIHNSHDVLWIQLYGYHVRWIQKEVAFGLAQNDQAKKSLQEMAEACAASTIRLQIHPNLHADCMKDARKPDGS